MAAHKGLIFNLETALDKIMCDTIFLHKILYLIQWGQKKNPKTQGKGTLKNSDKLILAKTFIEKINYDPKKV